MLSKKDIQFIRSLAVKKYRQKYHNYLAEGEKICLEIISCNSSRIDRFFATQEFIDKYGHISKDKSFDFELITEKELKKISQLKTPNQALAILNLDEDIYNTPGKFGKKIFYLDGIKDPGNLGTIIRSAEWFGVDHLILSPETVDPYNPKVVQSAMGSLFRQDMRIMDFEELYKNIREKQYAFYSAEMDGENAFETTFQYPCVVIMGSESHGVNLDISKYAGQRITIPRFNTKTESLNVGIAASILMTRLC